MRSEKSKQTTLRENIKRDETLSHWIVFQVLSGTQFLPLAHRSREVGLSKLM